jgi:hypothetical protein
MRGLFLSEDWQFCFFVKNLVAPEKEVSFDNVLIKGIPPSHDACIFFKTSIKQGDEKEKEEIEKNFRDILRNISLTYGLVANTYLEVLPSSSNAKIDSEHIFGDKRLCIHIGLIPVFDEERRKRDIPIIEKTLKKYGEIKSIFQLKKERFLKNAVDYYSRSLKDDLLEEKLIDLMISLESLFSRNEAELSYRISLRTSFFLGFPEEKERPEIFKKIYDLYSKRSTIVHGTENVKLEWNEVMWLQQQVSKAIKRFIHIELPQAMLANLKGKGKKQKLLSLLDEAIYDEEKRKTLYILFEEAIKKW